MTHAVGVILSHRRRIFCPGGKAACYCVHGAVLFVAALTRSVSLQFPCTMGRFFGALRVSQNDK